MRGSGGKRGQPNVDKQIVPKPKLGPGPGQICLRARVRALGPAFGCPHLRPTQTDIIRLLSNTFDWHLLQFKLISPGSGQFIGFCGTSDKNILNPLNKENLLSIKAL